MLYKTELQVNQVEIEVDSTIGELDLLCVDVYNNKSPVRFCCVYNPPCQDQSTVLRLCDMLRSILPTKTPFYILGDFNFPNINWTIPANYGNSAHSEFLNFCCSNSLSQCIDYSTHDKGNILDLLLCNHTGKNILINHTSNTPPWHTDHYLISFNLYFSPTRSRSTICS